MNIYELARTLPNGFHDTEVTEVAISYLNQTVRISALIWVGDMASRATREEYRPATIELTQVEYFFFDRPDPTYLRGNASLRIDLAEPDHVSQLSGMGTAFRLWVNEWNGFVHGRVGEAQLTWTGPAVARGA